MDISSLFLPQDLLNYFDVVQVFELGDCSTKKMIYEIHLTEKNQLPQGYNSEDYESKGFYSPQKDSIFSNKRQSTLFGNLRLLSSFGTRITDFGIFNAFILTL